MFVEECTYVLERVHMCLAGYSYVLIKLIRKTSTTWALAYLADDGGYDNYDYDCEDGVEENYHLGYNYEDSYDIDLRAGFGLGIVTSMEA
nr:hypothetical protein [Tanacetum cinerariifolium]